MPILEKISGCLIRSTLARILGLVALCSMWLAGGCSDKGMEALETDANGFYCTKCQAKFYTPRKVFLESKCPKCGEFTLESVVGYYCEKDRHTTVRPKVSGPEGAAVCEKCNANLKHALIAPRQKDLQAWGAVSANP